MVQKQPLGGDLSQELRAELRAEALPVGLRARQLRPCRGPYKDFVHLILLAEGQLHLEVGELNRDFEGPAALVLPPSVDHVLGLGAGASGWLLGLSPALLGELTGARPELEMQLLLSQSVIMASDLQGSGPLEAELFAEALMEEIHHSRPGHRTAVLAYLRLIILEIWRASYQESPLARFDSEAHLLESFRREVEVHFRSHLSISDYAQALGLSESRLRRICQRNLQRSPIQLVHQRLMREAVIWLGQSGRGVAEIALALGFADSAEFSHFFKRLSGQAPSQFRDQLRSSTLAAESEQNRFADWP